MFRSTLILSCLLLPIYADALDLNEDALDHWLEDEMPPSSAHGPGDDTLVFISSHEAPNVTHSMTRMHIPNAAMKDGWVRIEQCHMNLDAVPDAEVTYSFNAMKALKITESLNIEEAWVEGQSVQLKNIEHDARLCVELEARVLHQADTGGYYLRYGPFQRRFLDGYFPMHVSLEVDYTRSGLDHVSIRPEPTQGFNLKSQAGKLDIDAWFKGKLTIELMFRPN